MQVENKSLKIKKILLTGGHAGSTAYAFTQNLKKDNSFKWDIYWVGSKRAIEGSDGPSFEESVLPKLGVKVYSISAGRLQRRFTRYTIPSVLKIPLGFWQAFFVVRKIMPDVVVSFGGYASYPVVFMAKYFKIPIVIHEQTSVYGRASKASQAFADVIALSRRESLKYFDKKKAVIVGNPVSTQMMSVKPKEKVGNPPAIFVTGGSRGSENINEALEGILPTLLSKYKITHQSGPLNEEKYKRIKETLGKSGQNYEVHGLLNPDEMKKEVEKSDLIIARAGANTVSEILIAKRPSILIPIPWSFMDEQTKNAEYARNFGIANILLQKDLNPESLLKRIEETFSKWTEITKKVRDQKSPDLLAGKGLVKIVKEILK